MTELELMADLFKNAARQGPGSEETTKRALDLTGLDKSQNLKIADVGCGTGAQTKFLAENTNGHITAIDIFPQFLDKLNEKIKNLTLQSRISTDIQSMDKLPFAEKQFDLIWSEGAIYIMGFEKGIKEWWRFLKPEGILAVSEICWFTDNRPKELNDYWQQAYPEIDTAANKIKILEDNGYSPMAYFRLAEYCWTEQYYNPLKKVIPGFLARHNNSKEAIELVENERAEIRLYEKYKTYYGYGFYIAQKLK